MAMQTYAMTPARIDKFKGEIIGHAEPMEILGKVGRQIAMPKNASRTYVARSFLPWGGANTNQNTINRFYQDGPGDRASAIAQANQVSEGVTPNPDNMVARDITVTIQQYGCLYGFTDQTFDLYEDDIPAEMKKQVGERCTFVNEMIIYGALRGSTNQYFGGTGTSRATVNGGITLNMIRRIVRNLHANHAKPVNGVLSASTKIGTRAVAQGYMVYVHTDLEADVRDIPGFIPVQEYGQGAGAAMEGEIGAVERFRFIGHPDLPSIQDAGAAVGATGLISTTGSNIDVYQFIVCGENAWSQVSLRGKESLDPTYLPPSAKSKADPLGQRGYCGTVWYKAVMLENNGWMAVGNVGAKALPN